MTKRKNIPNAVQVEVLVQCRRRCCLCFGLSQDKSIKKGQIAHLDGDASNNVIKNLVFLCLDHHDEYDSTTRQSKGLKREEIEKYRAELEIHFSSWGGLTRRDELLNFIASQIDLDQMVDAAIAIAAKTVFYGVEHAFDVLITDSVDYCDGDLYLPHLVVLDHFASWGWVTYTEEERESEGEMPRVYIEVNRKTVCDEVASRLLATANERGESVAALEAIAQTRGWQMPRHYA